MVTNQTDNLNEKRMSERVNVLSIYYFDDFGDRVRIERSSKRIEIKKFHLKRKKTSKISTCQALSLLI